MNSDEVVHFETSFAHQWLRARGIVDGVEKTYDNICEFTLRFPPEKTNEVKNEIQEMISDFDLTFQKTEQGDEDFYSIATKTPSVDPDRGKLLVINLTRGDLDCYFSSHSLTDAERMADEWRENLEKYKKTEEGVVELYFTYYDQGRGQVSTNSCSIKVPEWKEISQNYVNNTFGDLQDVFNGVDLDKGKLMVWYGDTGTGKTYALRSFMRDLKGEYQFYYITDPDIFMNCPDYYYKLSSKKEDRKSLFIFEDCAKYISPETRGSNEAGIAKILNITDGLIGQGQEDLFIFTFNEQKDQIDDAIIRPGRCNKIVKFQKFSHTQGLEWLEENGYNGDTEKEGNFSLADLYSVLNDEEDESYDSLDENIGF